VLDTAPLRALAEEAGPRVAEKFLEDYLNLLAARSAAIIDGLNSEDREKTLDALISLGASSAMAGAWRVEDYARNLQRQVQSGHWPSATAAKALLSHAILQIMGAAVSTG
jgi:4-hydroxyphenylpyruvate dioxygenase-like putative hemolysin